MKYVNLKKQNEKIGCRSALHFLLFRTYLLICLIAYLLIAPLVQAEDYSSSNYKMINANLGEQPFITSKEVSPPSVTGPGPEVVEIKPTSVKIKWFTDKTSNSILAYGTSSGSYPTEISKATEYVTTHEVEIVGLTPKTTYYYKAKSTDLYGNTGESNERSFTTPLPKPTIVKIKTSNLGSENVTISFETDYYTTAVIEYINLNALTKKTEGESGYSKTHQIEISDLSDDQEYSYRVIARDDEGNESSTSSYSFKTDKDKIPPKLEGIKFDVNPISGTDRARIIISWKTNEPSTSQIMFIEGANGNPNTETPIDNNLTTNHIVTLVNLKPLTTYKLFASSVDKAGNIGKTEDFMVLTPKQKKTIFQIILDNLQEIFKPFSAVF